MTDDTVPAGAHWQRFATTESDEAYDYLRRAYLDFTVHFSRDCGNGVGIRTVAAALGDVSMARVHYAAHSHLETAPSGDLTIFHVLDGSYALHKDKDEHRLRAGDTALVLPDDPLNIVLPGADVLISRLPRELLEETAHAGSGVSGADLRFDSTRPVSAELARHWSATFSYLTRSVLSDPVLMANPLVVAQARRHLAQTALTVFPNTGVDPRLHPRGDVAPRALRRAMSHIEDNADRPIALAQIADAAGVQPRALQVAFRRHLDTTPTNYLRKVRLERAHRDLQRSDPATGVTVTMIAQRWGFPHLGRFSADYRRIYGFSPSHTLRT
jgi:AraC-like DNA-binding protein